jgi:hypothetical protein
MPLSSLLKHIQKHVAITDEDAQAIASYFQQITFKKKQNLQEEGRLCKSHFFVAKGCL